MAVALVALFVALGGTAAAREARSLKVLGSNVVSVTRVSEFVPAGRESGWTVAMCPRGYLATGGGAQHLHDFVRDSGPWKMVEVGPMVSPDYPEWFAWHPGLRNVAPYGWGAVMANVGAVEGRYAVTVVCAKPVVDQR
jgi:hypothetical protein